MSERIGLYGGSFDPIHHGHLIVTRWVAETLSLDRVILLPSAHPPNKPPDALAPASHRGEMVRLAIAGDPLFTYSDYDVTRPGPTYTVQTVTHFHKELGSRVALFWIIGADALAELTTWRNLPDILDVCEIVTADRPDAPSVNWDALRNVIGEGRTSRLQKNRLSAPPIAISSTDIRTRVRRGLPIRYLVPDAVVRYIKDHGLYGGEGHAA